jgi:DNA polymerase-3 subunit delta'
VSGLIGHEAVVADFLAAMRGRRMHHAWLFAGPEGVGKATAATALAKRLLCEAAGPTLPGDGFSVPENHPIGKLVDAYTHPDFILLDRLPKDMKTVREIERRDWPADLERARNITIEQVRALGTTFALTPSYSRSRIVLVDSIDDMERGAANALLKSLEEPPQGTIFLLISHAPGRLLPTIRSRCRTLRFDALDSDTMRIVLHRNLPDVEESELSALPGGGLQGRRLASPGWILPGWMRRCNPSRATATPIMRYGPNWRSHYRPNPHSVATKPFWAARRRSSLRKHASGRAQR